MKIGHCLKRAILLVLLAAFSGGCAQFEEPAPGIDHRLLHLIRKSNASCVEYVGLENEYYQVDAREHWTVLIPTGLPAESKHMYMMKRTLKSVSKLTKEEKIELRSLLSRNRRFKHLQEVYLLDQDVVIPLYSETRIIFD